MILARPASCSRSCRSALAVAMLADRTLLLPMLAADAGHRALGRRIDALLARRPLRDGEAPRARGALHRAPEPDHARAALALPPQALGARSPTTSSITAESDRPAADASSSRRREPRDGPLPRAPRASRGAHTIGDHHVRYLSPFGLWIRQVTVPAETPVKVYPDVQAVRTFELMARQDRDPSRARAPRASAAARASSSACASTVAATSSAPSTGRRPRGSKKLISREYQLESNQNLLFLLDARPPDDRADARASLFDHALNASLMLSHVAARGGATAVGLLAFADEHQELRAPAGERRGRRAPDRALRRL